MSSVPSKLRSIDDALGAVRDGMLITAGGFAHSHQPLALVRALLKRGVKHLSIAGVAECWVGEFLAAADVLDKAWFSNFMFEGLGRCRRFSEAVESGRIQVEDHSHWGMVNRLQASAMGLPFMPMRSMSGTDILNTAGFEPPQAKSRFMASPFGGENVTAVSPLWPDVALIHAARADVEGNVQLFGVTSVVEEQARAARHVIVSVEEIVDTDVIRKSPEFTILPGLMVDAVVLLPYGAHPTGVYNYYEHDMEFLEAYYAASRDDASLARHLSTWVHEPADHFAYLDAVGVARLMKLRVDPELGYALPEPSNA